MNEGITSKNHITSVMEVKVQNEAKGLTPAWYQPFQAPRLSDFVATGRTPIQTDYLSHAYLL